MIELKDITKTFIDRTWKTALFHREPKRVEALKGVSLKVEPGEIFGLLGPNGAGKTTLIKIMATLILPDGGKGNICGYDLVRQSDRVRRAIGFVNTSERSFYWRLTGRQNLSFFAALYNLAGRQGKGHVEKLLTFVGLADMADIAFMKYSSGQKQRLAIARALLSNPVLLLMDEPTNSLDPIAASEIRRFTKERLVAREGGTVLWCTHNLKEAEEICDRLSIIHKGKIIATGSLEYMKSLIDNKSSYRVKISAVDPEALHKMGITPLAVCRNDGYMEFDLRERQENITSVLKNLIEKDVKVYHVVQREIDLEGIFERLIQTNDN